ncbi:MAG: phosphotransferase enzyme family protein [Thermomicrobiales bacterium]
MRTQPPDLPPTLLQGTLSQFWDLHDLTLTYNPVGFGSHHWLAEAPDGQCWFVTVDDHHKGRFEFPPETSFDALDRAMRTAVSLRDLGLDFVVAPIPDHDGNVLHRLGDSDYSLVLFPFMEGKSGDYGKFASSNDRFETLRLIGHLHNATPSLPQAMPHRSDLSIPRQGELAGALDSLDLAWMAGPYADQTRNLLRENRDDIVRALEIYDRLVTMIKADPTPWVITHGEPHAGNVLRLNDSGKPLLVDWDTAALAPKERDLWMLLDDSATDWTPYLKVTGDAVVSASAIRMFQMWWDLCEIAEYASWFRKKHDDSEDARIGWGGLNECLPIKPEVLTTPR